MPEQVKVFSATARPRKLETQINKWLDENKGKIRIVQRSVVASGGINQNVTVIYHYEKL